MILLLSLVNFQTWTEDAFCKLHKLFGSQKAILCSNLIKCQYYQSNEEMQMPARVTQPCTRNIFYSMYTVLCTATCTSRSIAHLNKIKYSKWILRHLWDLNRFHTIFTTMYIECAFYMRNAIVNIFQSSRDVFIQQLNEFSQRKIPLSRYKTNGKLPTLTQVWCRKLEKNGPKMHTSAGSWDPAFFRSKKKSKLNQTTPPPSGTIRDPVANTSVHGFFSLGKSNSTKKLYLAQSTSTRTDIK